MPARPPKPKKGTPDDLAEVERALSVLQGRHPEHERARREDEEARNRRASALEKVARVESRQARSRRFRVFAAAVPIVALFAFIGVFGRREVGRRARIDAVADAFRVHGFTAIDTSLRGSTGAVEAPAEPGCFLVVSTVTEAVTITLGGVAHTAGPPALFCTCTNDRITATSAVGPQEGIALLRAEAPLVGGSRAFAYAPYKPASVLSLDDPCSDRALDAWIDAKRYPRPAVDDGWLAAAKARAPLASAGFHVVATARGELPFVVVDVPKESCLVATSATADDRITLRPKGASAAEVEGAGTIGRCAQTEATVIVTRRGSGDLAVLVGPASMVGGLLGLREITTSARLPLSSDAVPASDRSWDAKQVLLASAIPEAIINEASVPDVPFDADARIVALSFETQSALAPDTSADVHMACEPGLDPAIRESICVFSGAQKWHTQNSGAEAIGGLARSKHPFWLFAMQGARDPSALDAIGKLLTLARALGREGFKPTTIEAVVELWNGAEVLGRTGEDAVVAVGVAPGDPWVYPLADGAPWTLDEAPRITLVKPLEKVTLVTALTRLPPIQSRRTVVFRRQKP